MLLGIGIDIGSGFAGGLVLPGPNLLSPSAWTMYDSNTNSGGTLTCTGSGTGAQHIASQPITYVVGATYQFDADYTSTGNQFCQLTIDISAGAANTDQRVTSGYLSGASGHVSVTFTADIANGTCDIVQTNADLTGTLSNLSLKRIA